MADLFDILIAAAYLIAAAIIFDRVLPTLRKGSFAIFLKLWFLGVAVGMFGLGRLTGSDLFYNIGHPCLIAYVVLRIHQIAAGNPCRWGKQPDAET